MQLLSSSVNTYGVTLNPTSPLALPLGAINSNSSESNYFSLQESSPMLPLHRDSPHQAPAFPTSSLSSLKQKSTNDGVENEPAPKRVQRKRSSLRTIQSETDHMNRPTGNSLKSCPSRRLPHNQVNASMERLNFELEHLRRAIPTIPQRDSSDLTGPLQPSKAIIPPAPLTTLKPLKPTKTSF